MLREKSGSTLEGRVRTALRHADVGASGPLTHGRCSMVGLVLLQSLRVVAVYTAMLPAPALVTTQILSCMADICAVCCTLPLFLWGIRSQCVRKACLGPMLTMVFAMMTLDASGLAAYLVLAPHRPEEPGSASVFMKLVAIIDVWELLFFASVSLEMALATACWRVYRELRVTGLYPPSLESLAKGEKVEYVSMLELVCEPDDIKAMSTCCQAEEPLLEHLEDIRLADDTPAIVKAQSEVMQLQTIDNVQVVAGVV
eukprot:TRINITY_DN10582_c0_g1_i1.p1 TRINITY_DN10582_c0_g1~~TRINITY_DN10582_c0_g1_i1.p1  ORF type:complete len:256 (+),score=43.11 TRINITY_DN10582_c0_g1_i1:173-940(+)